MKNTLTLLFLLLIPLFSFGQRENHVIGIKSYEVSNHLGNVAVVLSDRKINSAQLSSTAIAHSETDIISYNDYYPYGMLMEKRNDAGDYRFGFQGQEKDDEVKGKGNSVNYKYRMHDVRVGRFFAVDPLAAKYAYNSVYAFSENRVVDAVELEGLEKYQLQGKWKIELLSNGYLVLIPPQNEEEFNADFEVTDEGGTKLKHFKYTDFEKQMMNAKIRLDKNGITGTKVKIDAPNTSVYRGEVNTSDWRIRAEENGNKTEKVQLDFNIKERVLDGTKESLVFKAPITNNQVSYSLDAKGLAGNAPNLFIVYDSKGKELTRVGTTSLSESNSSGGDLNFSISGGEEFTIEVIGNPNADARDVFSISGKINYDQSY